MMAQDIRCTSQLRRAITIAALLCLIATIYLYQVNRVIDRSDQLERMSSTDHTGSSKHVPLIIFKLPRTGSSWFNQELNSISSVFISKEIIQLKDRGRFTLQEIEAHLIKALRTPTGKLSSSDRWLPDGRFAEDYMFHRSWKTLRTLSVIGFSVNPEHCVGVNWTTIMKAVPNVKIINYIRTNIIKTAVSSYRGKQTHHLCGVSNMKGDMKTGLPQKECNIPDRIEWSVGEFTSEIGHWQNRVQEFWKATDCSTYAHCTVLTYEHLQSDLKATMTKLFHFLGRDEVYSNHVPSVRTYGWAKRTTEDLRGVIVRYEEIKLYLSGNSAVGSKNGKNSESDSESGSDENKINREKSISDGSDSSSNNSNYSNNNSNNISNNNRINIHSHNTWSSLSHIVPTPQSPLPKPPQLQSQSTQSSPHSTQPHSNQSPHSTLSSHSQTQTHSTQSNQHTQSKPHSPHSPHTTQLSQSTQSSTQSTQSIQSNKLRSNWLIIEDTCECWRAQLVAATPIPLPQCFKISTETSSKKQNSCFP